MPDLLPEAIWTGLEPGKRACYDDDRIDHHSRLLVVQTPVIRQRAVRELMPSLS